MWRECKILQELIGMSLGVESYCWLIINMPKSVGRKSIEAKPTKCIRLENSLSTKIHPDRETEFCNMKAPFIKLQNPSYIRI